MGVTAVSASSAARRLAHGTRRFPHPRPGARRHAARTHTGRGRYAPPLITASPTFWERMQDDQDLIRFKVVILAAVAFLTAILEWVA
jgi:hypothetical protein